MIITFTPTDGESRTYLFDPQSFPNPDAERVEELTGLTWEQAKVALLQGSAKVRRAVVFCFERRTHSSLSWSSFGQDWPVGAVLVEFSRDELERMAAAVESTPGLSEADRASAAEQFEALMEDAPEAPKAPVPHGVPAT